MLCKTTVRLTKLYMLPLLTQMELQTEDYKKRGTFVTTWTRNIASVSFAWIILASPQLSTFPAIQSIFFTTNV